LMMIDMTGTVMWDACAQPPRDCGQDMSEYPADLRDMPLCIECSQRAGGGCCPETPILQRLREAKNMRAAGHDPTFRFGDG
jgi:hypothetical protein